LSCRNKFQQHPKIKMSQELQMRGDQRHQHHHQMDSLRGLQALRVINGINIPTNNSYGMTPNEKAEENEQKAIPSINYYFQTCKLVRYCNTTNMPE